MGKKSRSKADRRRVRREFNDLSQQFWEQVDFIESSATLFDQGKEHEAKRIAVSLRILVHESGRSHSLLGQLTKVTQLLMLNTSAGVNPHNIVPTAGLVAVEVSKDGARYVPTLSDTPQVEPQLLSLKNWATMAVTKLGSVEWVGDCSAC